MAEERTEEDSGIKDLKVFDGENWISLADVSAEGQYVRRDGTLPMSGFLKTPGIQGIQKRDANIDPDNPISFVEVIDGGSDGGDPSDDHTYFMCSSDIYFANAPGTAIDVPAYKITNLKDPEDKQDGATKSYVDTKISGVTGSVTSVNAKTGVVVLTAADVSAKPDSYNAPVDSVNAKTGVVVLTAADVSAKPDSYNAPVDSVNAKTGVVVLTAADVGALENLPIQSEDGTVILRDDADAGFYGQFIVETGTDVLSKSTNTNVFGVNGSSFGDATVIMLVDSFNQVMGWLNVGDRVTGENIPDGSVIRSVNLGNNSVTISKPATNLSPVLEEVTFSRDNDVESGRLQSRLQIDAAGRILATTPDYEPDQDNSLVNKKYLDSKISGDFLPLAGGTMDAGADVIIPSGASVNANMMVGGTVNDTIRDTFNISARGTTAALSPQIVSWAKDGGSAYFKLCLNDAVTNYWNIIASPLDEDETKYLRFADEEQNWVTYVSTKDSLNRKITHVPYTEFSSYIGTRFIYTIAKAENDCVIGLINNQVDIIRGSLDVSPMIGASHLNSFGVGSDGIVVESADVFERPDGWDDETQGDPAESIDQPRSGIAFKGPYSLGNVSQNYYASIEGVRGSRTNGYKSGACRISVNSTGNTDPEMNTAAYFGWDFTVIKSGNDGVICNTKWNSQSIVNQCTNLITKPVTDKATGYLDFDFYDNSRASCIGWYSKDYKGGTVAGAGAGSTFFWANDGNTLSLAADGIRINSQSTGALTQYQWEFEFDGSLVSQGGQLQVPRITTQYDAEGDLEIVLNKKTASFQTDGKNNAVVGQYEYKRNNGDTDAVASVSSRNGTLQAYVPTVVDEDYVAIDIYEGLNSGGAGQSIQWNNAGGAFACPSSEIKSKRISTGDNFELIFSSMVGNSLQEYLKMTGGQLTTYTGYEPDSDESLVTKKWVDTKVSGVSYDDTAIKADLTTETAARQNADVALQQNIGSEATTRNTADEALQQNINANKAYTDSRIWQGTQTEFNAIGSGNYDESILYCITG